ncbi:MAG: DUF1343 domain-containing protein [Saprospiraceae bacterium]|nr:DUF1343 domain-containing protein [Saprospiraceae bacterium]
MTSALLYGIDTLLQDVSRLKGLNIAMVTNDAAITCDGIPSRQALLEAGVNLVSLFSPEHGMAREGEDGAAQADGTDAVTVLPMISLYGDKMKPSPQDLAGIDAVLFDIPDIGCRFYTYLWTMTHVMEVCCDYGKKFVVLDRPNPIGALAEEAEGPMLDETHCASFLGRWYMPLKHGHTLGELALYFAATRIRDLQIEVVPMQHYQRTFIGGVDFPFVPTSPAMQRIQAALLYPGTGLLEGINVNEGRGTATPFEIFGAPWLAAEDVADKLNHLLDGGITFEPCIYQPEASLYAGEACNGIRMKTKLAPQPRAVANGLTILRTLLEFHPNLINERSYPTVANPSGTGHLDRLLGVAGVWKMLKQGGMSDTSVSGQWQPDPLY